MYFVYLLRTQSENLKFYIGFTEDIERRIEEHARGSVTTTHRLGIAELIYYEAYRDREAAQEREKKLKQFGSSYVGLLKRLRLK